MTTTPKRMAEFDSASAEYEDEPIGFKLDGKVWICYGVPTARMLKMISHDMMATEIVREAVQDKEGWDARVNDEDNPLPMGVVRDIAYFLVKEYFGVELGKSKPLPPTSSRTGGTGKAASAKRQGGGTRSTSQRAKSSRSRTAN